MTAHKAQGGTWDLAITVGLDGLYREAGYLVMSRGRHANWLIVTQPELDHLDDDLARHDSPLPLPGEHADTLDQQLVDRFSTSRRKQLAHTRDPHTPAIQHAATTLDYPTLERWADHARTVELQATRLVGDNPDRIRDRLARLDHTARHVAVGRDVKAWDRRNIGTITSIDDTAATADVTFVNATGHTATRTLHWADITITDRHAAPRLLDTDATATLARERQALSSQLERWTDHLARHGVQPGDRHVYEHAADLAVDRAAATLTGAQPAWLTATAR